MDEARLEQIEKHLTAALAEVMKLREIQKAAGKKAAKSGRKPSQ